LVIGFADTTLASAELVRARQSMIVIFFKI
jgi:hypothetical protein